MTTGLYIRTGVRAQIHTSMMVFLANLTGSLQIIGSVFRKSLRLSGKSRMNHSVGQITTMISTDATRLDRFSGFAHEYGLGFVLHLEILLTLLIRIWVSPIQVFINTRSLLLSQHLHLVGHWFWTSHRNRVYLSFLPTS